MKAKILIAATLLIIQGSYIAPAYGQNSNWTVQKCIDYALQKNIQVQKSLLNTESNKVNFDAVKASRFPIVDASTSQSIGWADKQNVVSGNYSFNGTANSNYSVNSSMTLYAGSKIKQSIKQSELVYKAGQYDSEAMKETISLNIMDAFLQILYAGEQVKNTQNQIDLTNKELELAKERLDLGVIATSDYLLVKSQLATEQQNLASAQGLLATDRVTLMQFMELPITDTFQIAHPDLTNVINRMKNTLPDSVYRIALGLKPQIKSAELNTQSAALSVDIANADYKPRIGLSAGFNTNYLSSIKSSDYPFQLSHNFSPSIGLSLSVPIYHNNEIRSKVDLAKISTENAKLDEQNTKNVLRKSIETACTNVVTAQNEYDASREQYLSAKESYTVAAEKYAQEILNSTDFLVQKTNYNAAESAFLQSKYNLIFTYKTLDFYLGIPFNF
ncbi:MAG: TolC family protein [Bacteroidota bacterium]|nr:TolC family protein [Bacteroidota bacterium]